MDPRAHNRGNQRLFPLCRSGDTAMTRYVLGLVLISLAVAASIIATPNGMVWYSESGVNPNTLVQFDPKTKAFSKTDIPSGGGVVRNMAATKDGRIYLACSGVNKVAVVIP